MLSAPVELPEGVGIRTRDTVLTLLLIASMAGVGLKIYSVWQSGPWDMPQPVKPKAPVAGDEVQSGSNPPPALIGTEGIIAKNLFDPERGASRTKEAEADQRAAQRIRSMLLLGTAILGPSRFAIVQDSEAGPGAPAGVQAATQEPRRMKLGDTLEGFRLTEVDEKKVVFAKGGTRVELPIDYFRKVPVAAPPSTPQERQPRVPGLAPRVPGVPRVPGQVTPGVPPGQVSPGLVPRNIPNLPRRPRLPAPPEQ